MGRGKVIISGYYGCGNLGDEAILAVLLDRLRARWPKLEITVLSGRPSETARVYRVQAINRWNLLRIARELRSADLLISGGGGLLQDRTSWRSPLYYLGVISLAQRLGRPVFIIGQGLGPLRRRWLQRLAQRRLRRVAYALLRDEASFALLQGWGLAADRLALGSDLALLGPKSTPPATPSERPYCVAALRGPLSESSRQRLAGALDELASTFKLRIVLLALSARGDRELLEAISRRLQSPNLLLAPQNEMREACEALELIAGARFVLGMRLHALIFALLTATPFAAISEDPKIDHFLAQVERASGLRLPRWPLSALEGSSIDLASGLSELIREREGNEMREACGALRRGAAQLAAETAAALSLCFDRMDPVVRRQR